MFKRIIRLFKAIINFFLRKAENHDPQLLLNQAVEDMNAQMRQCKKEVGEAIAEEKKLARQVETQKEAVEAWTTRARKAVQAKDDELAKEALIRKKEHESQYNSLKAVHVKQVQACSNLKEKLKGFNRKIEEAKRKKGVLIARHEAAEAQQQIAEAESSFEETSAFGTFEQMENRITEIEAQAEATYELTEETTGDSLAKRFEDLESQSNADDELAALKAEMGLAPAEEKQVTKRVAADTSDIDAEFEALAEEEAEVATRTRQV